MSASRISEVATLKKYDTLEEWKPQWNDLRNGELADDIRSNLHVFYVDPICGRITQSVVCKSEALEVSVRFGL